MFNMHNAIAAMLSKYECRAHNDSINALREILQEIALLGLWRAKFFEKAAFYGGTALRVLCGLDRFSEDMDFSLLEPFDSKDANFSNVFDGKSLPTNQRTAPREPAAEHRKADQMPLFDAAVPNRFIKGDGA